MNINIAYLYYDILNLYGESGNIKALKHYFESLNIKTNINFLTITDKINLKNIDLVYLGSGTEDNQKLVLKHIVKYESDFREFINNNKYIIATGNSLELFGKYIINNKKKTKTLGIFNFNTTNEDFRIVDEVIYESSFTKQPILGFLNHNNVIKDITDNHLFKVKKGVGSYPKSEYEGYTYNNFYGTYLIGPLLVRNPGLLQYICNKLIKEKYPKLEISKVNLTLENKAHKEFIENYCIEKDKH